MERRRDPWAPFRIWIALTIGLYALRAAFVTTPLGAIPGFVLLAMVLGALLLAARALLWPGRVTAWREGPAPWWAGRHQGRDGDRGAGP